MRASNDSADMWNIGSCMNRRDFLKILVQSSSGIGASVFCDRAWGIPIVNLLKSRRGKMFTWGEGTSYFNFRTVAALKPSLVLRNQKWDIVRLSAIGSADSFVFGGTTNGDFYCWGKNNYGQLGLGTSNTAISTPTFFGSRSIWSDISCGSTHSLGLRSDGTLWSWGDGSMGQLGIGAVGTQLSPVQVGNVSLWSQVFSGVSSSYALRGTDLFSFGNNANGKLGIGSAVHTSSPVQVPGSWKTLAPRNPHILAIRTDNSLWGWGYNGTYEIGQISVSPKSSPVQIAGGNNWNNVFSGPGMSWATKQDGTLWAWGKNTTGQLGVGYSSGTPISTPVQIGTDTNWLSLSAGQDHCIAIKTDGSLWAWGNANSNGAIGNGQVTGTFMTPQPIASGAWSSVFAFDQWSVAISK